ncbi:uncharacterized protein LOC135503146 [Lineus longissimus]|uniref:uncharacterized protein LOC135503146 n=1 Tax=Lineus longissimus TaxID=88925 RepID=UPI002B4E4B53
MDQKHPRRTSKSVFSMSSGTVMEESEQDVPFAVESTPSAKSFTNLEDATSENGDLNFSPPENGDLPNLEEMLEDLEGEEESDLATKRTPPSLFTRPEHVDNYKKISELRLEMEDIDIAPYVERFEDDVRDDILMIGSISLEEVQEEERRLRDEHVLFQEQEAKRTKGQQEKIVLLEEKTKKHIARTMKEKRDYLSRREFLAQQRERLLVDNLHKTFRRAENRLLSALEHRKGEVKTMYGDLQVADGQYGGSKGRRWKVDWENTPQPIQVKLKCLRGVKDKLPAGRYVLMVSLYNRLGGNVMRWSKLKGQEWAGSTLPLNHDGHFYNYECKIDQSVFTVLPAKPSIRPGMILLFELFLMRGKVVPTDRVVGWSCFPISDANFEVIEGKYKVPLLRGPMDQQIDKHERLEELMASDLDHWLCNLYFETVRLPRYLGGQKEFEVELQFTSSLLNFPDRIHGAEENRDGEDPVPGSTMGSTATQIEGSHASLRLSAILDQHRDEDTKLPPPSEEDKLSDTLSLKDLKNNLNTRPMTSLGSRSIHKEKKVLLGDTDSSDDEEEEVYMQKREEEFLPVKGEPGMYYKRHLNNPVDVYHKKFYSLLPKTPLMTTKKPKRKMTHLEELEQHTFSVKEPFSDKGRTASNGLTKVNYMSRQLMSELGLSQWRSREFWAMLLMLIVVFFVRMYMHYIGQWLFLQAKSIPINKFEFLPHTVNLNYQNTLLLTWEEIGIVTLGPLMNIVIFGLLISLSFVCQRIFHNFPDLGSKFVFAYGIFTFFDWLLILIVDCIIGRYADLGGDNPIADFAKLWWHFSRTQGSGLGGAMITLFLYIFLMFFTGLMIYMYFLRLHNNGRMLDIYWRLHGAEENFFVPYDLELSNYELSYISKRAEQWRGEEGERKKVAVYDYVWEEDEMDEKIWDENVDEEPPEKEKKQEVTTHVSIHTIHLDGLRELHRHFLRLPDGGIVEVFGDMAVPGMDKDVKTALIQGTQVVENLYDSQENLGRNRKRPQTVWTVHGLQPDAKDSFYGSKNSLGVEMMDDNSYDKKEV